MAVNSAWNHTHSLFGWNATVALSAAVKKLKGKTSYDWNQKVCAGIAVGPRLKWQRGYGAVSIHRNEIKATMRYIDRQKHHHAKPNNHNLRHDFETTEFDEIDDPKRQRTP